MKLYTEQQVKYILDLAHRSGVHIAKISVDVDKKLKPIELPSDEEIMKMALENTADINTQIAFNNGAVYICKIIEGVYKLIELQFNTKEK
jgi:hypothetical protein